MSSTSVQSEAPLWVRVSAAAVRYLPFGRYRAMNLLGRQSSAPFLTRMPRELGGSCYSCDLRDSIAREVCFTGCYEPQETALLRACLRPGMTFVDVGANWGYFTLLAAGCVGATGRVVSLEPDPRLFALLQANVRQNSLGTVLLRQLAAADRVGTLHLAGFDEAGDNWGLSRLVRAHTAGSLEVVASPLDSVLDESHVDTVDVAKIDVEGAENLVLRGMDAGLRTGRYRRIILEVHPTLLAERGETVAEVCARLTDAGYRAWRIDHSRAATRRAAYGRQSRAVDFLRPAGLHDEADAWPHLLWCAPGVQEIVA